MWYWSKHTYPWLAGQHSKTKATKKGKMHNHSEFKSCQTFSSPQRLRNASVCPSLLLAPFPSSSRRLLQPHCLQ